MNAHLQLMPSWLTFCILHPLMIAALSVQAVAVEYGEPLMFGIDVVDVSSGVRVEKVHSNRPIGTKLKAGDVLRAYRDGTSGGQVKSIRTKDDIDAIKSLLEQDKIVEVTLWRPDGPTRPPSRYLEKEVLLFSSDLLPLTSVGEVARTVTVMVPENVYSGSPNESDSVVLVRVFYATDRKLSKPVGGVYTGQRDRSASPIKYGSCLVTLPPDHRMGELEEPKWWKLEFRENPHKHVVLSAIDEIGKTGVLRSISKHFRDYPRDKRRLLVFVHGYNVSFEDAARRTAQLHHDLNFPGLSTFFSWPSNGTTAGYVSDAGDIEWSTPHIEEYLRLVCSRDDIDEVIVLAHSMGNRGVTKALGRMASSEHAGKIKEVILAAPDIDADIFEREISPALISGYPRTTLYASSKDKALWASEALSEVYRAGEIRVGLPTVSPRDKLDIIDASAVESGFMGHSYYGDGESVISDMWYLMRNSLPAGQRFKLLERTGPKGKYWMFR